MKTYRVAALTFTLVHALAGGAAGELLPCAVVEGSSMADRQRTERPPTEKRFDGERFVRTELFFGSARPGGEVARLSSSNFSTSASRRDSPTASPS